MYEDYACLIVTKRPRGSSVSVEYRVKIDHDDVGRVGSLKWVAANNSKQYFYFKAMHGSMLKAGVSLRNVALHRILVDAPDGYLVDHINNDTLDNRKSNLRIVAHTLNCLNRADLVGSIRKQGGKYCPVVSYQGHDYGLGTFDDFSHAAAARIAAKRLLLQLAEKEHARTV